MTLKAARAARSHPEALQSAPAHDAVVVLAYLPESELRQLASELPEVDAVVGGPTGQSIAPFRIGPTWIGSATNKGKFLIELETSGSHRRLVGESHRARPWRCPTTPCRSAISPGFAPSSPGWISPPNSRAWPRRRRQISRAGYRVAGSRACRRATRTHQKSMNTRNTHWPGRRSRSDGQQMDPQCQTCHTTGYGLPGGFQSISQGQARTAVGCESCHGPSQGHVEQARVRTPFAARDQCVVCHDQENSPRFSFEEFWNKIRHGKASAAPVDPASEGASMKPLVSSDGAGRGIARVRVRVDVVRLRR